MCIAIPKMFWSYLDISRLNMTKQQSFRLDKVQQVPAEANPEHTCTSACQPEPKALSFLVLNSANQLDIRLNKRLFD